MFNLRAKWKCCKKPSVTMEIANIALILKTNQFLINLIIYRFTLNSYIDNLLFVDCSLQKYHEKNVSFTQTRKKVPKVARRFY